MAEIESPTTPTTPPVEEKTPPFVTLIYHPEHGEQYLSNIIPKAAPVMLWLMVWGIFQLMTGKITQQPVSKLVTPNGHGLAGFRKKMGL